MAEEGSLKKRDTNWLTVLWMIHLHALGLYGLWLLVFEASWMTVFFAIFITFIAILGITVGAHRYWAHQTFSASWQVRLFLALAHTLAGVGPIYDWVLAHRIHHKFYGTDKDPFNHNKGFLYSHFLSSFLTPHPEQEKIQKDIDMRDIELDGFVWIQRRFYWVLFILFGLLLPINAPAEYWGESLKCSFFIMCFTRLAITSNASRLVNSAKLIWGMREGDKFPADDNSVFFVTKSYWPNYHYLVSWDWKSGEFGGYDSGCGTFFIKMCYELGLVDRMITVSSEAIREALHKTATTKATIEDTSLELKSISELEVAKEKLRYHH